MFIIYDASDSPKVTTNDFACEESKKDQGIAVGDKKKRPEFVREKQKNA